MVKQDAAQEKVALSLRNAGLSVQKVPVGLAVSSALFVRPDQDRSGCYVCAAESGHWRLEDAGDTLCDATDDLCTRAVLLARSMGAQWDEDSSAFHRTVDTASLSRAVTQFLCMLTLISELDEQILAHS